MKSADVEQLLACTNETRRADGTTAQEPSEGWYLPLAPLKDTDRHRWRHAGLERWQALPDSKRPDLTLGLSSSNRGVAAAAAIGLARTEGERNAAAVADVASNPLLSLSTRRAAIETLARLADSGRRAEFDRLFSDLANPEAATYQPLLHVELLNGLNTRRTPGSNPRIRAALEISSPEVRCAALEMLAASPAREFPREAIALLNDGDLRVRMAALRAAAACRAPDALDAAILAARDPEPALRFAGIETLGALGGEDATRELRELATRDAELIQEAAVTALGKVGDYAAVRTATGDKSWRVRRAAATAMAANATSESAATLRKLLSDRSTEVQRGTVEVAAAWPMKMAGPLLLTALESPHFATRSDAQAALARLWPPAHSISPADIQQLSAMRTRLVELRAAWRGEFGDNDELVVAPIEAAEQSPAGTAATPGRTPPDESPEELDVAALKTRLLDANKHARLTAAHALARQGYESGTRALESLTFDLDPEIRRSSAAAIGSLADPLQLAILVRLLDDEPSVRLAALKGLRQSVGRDVARESDPPPKNAAEEAERWKAWYLRGGRD